MAQGTIKRFDFRKGFGFISDDTTGEDFFFHKTEWQSDGKIRKGLSVTFIAKDSDKGPHAESVNLLDSGSSKASNSNNAAKPTSVEGRIAALESSLGTWKTLSIIALAGVIVLAIGQFVL